MQNHDFDVRAAREKLGLTPEQFAAELYVTEREVRAWESGGLRLPKRMRKSIEYHVARAEWDARMEASGLPVCAWMEEAVPKFVHATSGSEKVKRLKEVTAHAEACECCQARSKWAREHLPPPPAPPPTWSERAMTAIGRLPEWAQPAAYGAIALFLMTGVRALFFLPQITRAPMRLVEALVVSLLAAAAGAVGGFGYSLTRPSLVRLGWLGDYLSGIVAVMCYLGALAAVSPLLGEPMIRDLPGVLIFTFVSVLFGVLVGKMIQEHRTLPRAQG